LVLDGLGLDGVECNLELDGAGLDVIRLDKKELDGVELNVRARWGWARWGSYIDGIEQDRVK